MKKITIQDIAEAANVSKSTVSRVLNGSAAVNDDKRKAVLEATERLGFKPNEMARSLASGKSMIIGVLTQQIGSPFFDSIAQGVIVGLSGSGYSPLFVDGRLENESQVEAIRTLLGRRVDGLILIGGQLPGETISKLCEDVPTIIVARKLAPERHYCIYTNNIDGGYRATQHLIEMGHREIAFIEGIEHHPDGIERRKGYNKALTEAGIEVNSKLVIQGDFTAESGVRAIKKLRDSNAKFSAVFAANDATAYGARLALHRNGLRVPEDVSIVGFDDQAESAYVTPPLTTVRQPGQEMGVMAVKGIISLIDNEPFESVEFLGELSVRDSTARLQS